MPGMAMKLAAKVVFYEGVVLTGAWSIDFLHSFIPALVDNLDLRSAMLSGASEGPHAAALFGVLYGEAKTAVTAQASGYGTLLLDLVLFGITVIVYANVADLSQNPSSVLGSREFRLTCILMTEFFVLGNFKYLLVRFGLGPKAERGE